MPESNTARYDQMQHLVKRDILRINASASNLSQYRVASIQAHKHDNISSNPIIYTTLSGVQNFLVSNTITLSASQILALYTTPIVLVAPPASRSFIFVEGVAGRLTYSGNVYLGTNNLEFRYTNGNGLKVAADMPGALFLNATSNTYSYSPWQVDYDRNVDSNFTPTGGGTGTNGQIVVSVSNSNPTVVGQANLTATGAISSGATTATLTAPWSFATGSLTGTFSDGQMRTINVTNGSTSISWTPGLLANVNSAIAFQGYIGSSVTLIVYYRVVSFTT